jgi:type I restriction enzyme S subunit
VIPTVRLGELIAPATLRRAGKSNYPILSMTMRSGLVDQTSKFKKRVASIDTSTYKLVSRSQLVVGFPIDEGVLAFQRLYDNAIVSPAYDIWDIVDQSATDPQYLERFLRSPKALAYYSAKLRGTTARRRSLPRETLLDLRVPLPSMSTQRRIAESLDQLDALRAKRRRALACLNELAQSIFLEMFGNPASNGSDWPLAKVGDLLASASYGTSQKAQISGDIPILRMNNVTAAGELDMTNLKYLDASSVSERHTVRAGDILFNRTNSAELVGKSAVYRLSDPVAYAGYLVRLRLNSENHPEYLAAFLNSRYAKRVLRSMCRSIIGMANINARELQEITIPVPPFSDQCRFAHRVEGLEALKVVVRLQLKSFDELFQSLQYRAFRGEL